MDFERLNQTQISRACGVSRKTVSAWTKSGCPRRDDKSYSLPKVIAWLVDRATDAETPSSPEADHWLTEFRKERALKARIERKQLEKKLWPKALIARQWALRVGEVTAGLEALKDRLPPLLEGKSRAEMRGIIANEVWTLRDVYARRGEYCETPAEMLKKKWNSENPQQEKEKRK